MTNTIEDKLIPSKVSDISTTVQTKTAALKKDFDQNFSSKEFAEVWDTAPQSSEYKIVFPWDQDVKEYSTIDFMPQTVGNRVSYTDMTSVMQSLKCIEQYDSEAFIKSKRILKNLLILVPIITAVCMLFFLYDHIDIPGEPINLAIIVAPIFMAEVAWLLLLNKWTKHNIKSMLEHRQLEIVDILDAWNQNKFGPLGLHWSSGNLGAWLELDVLYRFKGEYMPEQVFPRCTFDESVSRKDCLVVDVEDVLSCNSENKRMADEFCHN